MARGFYSYRTSQTEWRIRKNDYDRSARVVNMTKRPTLRWKIVKSVDLRHGNPHFFQNHAFRNKHSSVSEVDTRDIAFPQFTRHKYDVWSGILRTKDAYLSLLRLLLWWKKKMTTFSLICSYFNQKNTYQTSPTFCAYLIFIKIDLIRELHVL